MEVESFPEHSLVLVLCSASCNYKGMTEEVVHFDTVISVGALGCVQADELLGSTPEQFVLNVQLCVLQGHLHMLKYFWGPVKCDFQIHLCMK